MLTYQPAVIVKSNATSARILAWLNQDECDLMLISDEICRERFYELYSNAMKAI